MTSPFRESSRGAGFMTLCRTVAICGRWFGVTIVAMMLPPKAGRVWWRFPVSASMSSTVQSAVRPVYSLAATFGMKERPMAVAPARMISGLWSVASVVRTAQ